MTYTGDTVPTPFWLIGSISHDDNCYTKHTSIGRIQVIDKYT